MGNDMLHDGFQRLGQAPDWRPNPTVRIIPKAASYTQSSISVEL